MLDINTDIFFNYWKNNTLKSVDMWDIKGIKSISVVEKPKTIDFVIIGEVEAFKSVFKGKKGFNNDLIDIILFKLDMILDNFNCNYSYLTIDKNGNKNLISNF